MGDQYRRIRASDSACRYGMNQSGVPDFARCARSVSVSSPAPVAPAHAASTASDGTGWAAFSALVTTGRDTFSLFASAPCDS